MKTTGKYLLMIVFLMLFSGIGVKAQGKSWTLEECINYALARNIQVKKADLSNIRNEVYARQAQAGRLPSLNASVRENFNWYKGFDSSTGVYGSSNGSNSTNYSINSSVSLFNGQKLTNRIRQAEIDLMSGNYYSETVKESVGLNIMNAFLQVLFAHENVINAEKQIEATTEQLALAKERLDLSVISMSDFLQIKSELASEKSTLANAQSQYVMYKVSLMQLMELPVDDTFTIGSPDLDSLLMQDSRPDAQEIYTMALGMKPQIKNAELNKASAQMDVKIARADALPSLALDAGLSSGYSSLLKTESYTDQLRNKVNPSVGLSLAIPIFQKKQVRTNIAVAKIAISDAELDEINTKNQLRKEIEQACVNVISAQSEFEANLEQAQARAESYEVSTEKFKLGLINSVDYLFEKTSLITSDSNLLHAKYNLIFSYKVLDFYKGISLTL